MNFAFHPEAETEFLEAVNYYEDRERGLGYDFAIEVLATIQNIAACPTAWPAIEEGARRCLVHRFPFGVIYSTEQEEILVLAVMHLRRHPDYWKERY